MTIDLIKGPFDVSEDDLKTLNPTEAVEVFHEMLVAEATGTSQPMTAINVPKAITTADGGVDAEVTLMQGAKLPGGLLYSGLVRYQIKTGGFSASGTKDIKALLLQPKYHNQKSIYKPEHLNPRVSGILCKRDFGLTLRHPLLELDGKPV